MFTVLYKGGLKLEVLSSNFSICSLLMLLVDGLIESVDSGLKKGELNFVTIRSRVWNVDGGVEMKSFVFWIWCESCILTGSM